MPDGAPRVRDPARKEKILAAAAFLIARNGYHSVSMADIGREAGIVGSGIYRHFDGKAAILVAIFDQVIDDLLTDEQRIVESQPDLVRALDLLIDGQVEFVVGTRAIAQVYHNEIANLPDEDRSRLRRKQRLYVEDWVHVVRALRPDLDDVEARTLVHAAISAIQSTLFHHAGLDEERLHRTLAASARRILLAPVD
ncbi:TetR/AcrR family transcriptional regulator [Nocardioides mangrovicus]|uniref:TetR/AcrR family transcriptional regulator n=1 Tax=Nocardioides mangrovicus TaxID=2478913 RepID=A0A3L8P8S1_9ACTN|nr:TetR/AcrR family transcriptional regulator [Nocardioides mangrovicus]RLV50928.1 TetR/AcrR family transcriptional regulator [Nocardioides mangrovicus]